MIKFTANRGLGRAGNFQPDRRPFFFLSLYNGSYTSAAPNPYGLENNWKDSQPNPMNWLLMRLSGAYVTGYRRMLLYVPAGSPSGQGSSYFAADQWFNMPAAKQSGFLTGIAPWLASRPDLDVGVYMGFLVQSGANPSTGVYGINDINDPANVFNKNNIRHIAYYKEITSGWKAAGIKFIISDFSAPYPHQFKDMVKFMPEFRWIGEAVPRVAAAAGSAYSFPHVSNGPAWMSTDTYQQGTVDPSNTWVFNPRNTECSIVFQSNSTSGAFISGMVSRGWVPMDYNGFSTGYILNHYVPSIDDPGLSWVAAGGMWNQA